MEEADFGTYHRSTREESENMREKVASLFSQAFRILEGSSFVPVEVLDAGSGHGFLSSLVASKYTDAFITGADSFEDGSLLDSSLEKAVRNAEILGFRDRVKFLKADLRDLPVNDCSFDLVVTSLVYHNIRKEKEKALKEITRVLRPGGYLIFGDIFTEGVADALKPLEYVNRFRIKRQEDSEYSLLVLRKP
jgi:ubiquinone/menaquinone biosynthesis C-methylase UbiE